MNFELNNVRKDYDIAGGKITKTSPVVEVFAAMTNGESLERFGKKADVAVNYIKNLGMKAENGDIAAISELNTIRRFVIESPIMEEIKLLGIFGSYTAVGFDETIEREIYNHVGEKSREQANNGDVVFPAISKQTYPVATFTVSGGYEVDYRRVQLGDMSKENEGMAQVRTSILNQAKLAIMKKVYDAVANCDGVKYVFSGAGLTKTGVDSVLNAVRRNGRPTMIGDYAMISQLTPFAGYVGSINNNTITGISEKIMNELQAQGSLSMYNGAVVSEMQNPYNLYDMSGTFSVDGGVHTEKNFAPLLPANLMFVIPAGAQSPIATYTRGGLTSMTGNDVKTGKIISRFDLECGVDVARGREWQIGLIRDENIAGI